MTSRPLTQDAINRAPEWMREIPLRADRWRDAHTRAALETDGDEAVAVGMLWTSRVHGDRYWFEIAVDPARRRRGHGRAMLDHLSTLRAADIPFMVRGYADEERLSFCRAMGARTIQIVPPSLVAVANRHMLARSPSARGAGEIPWDELTAHNAEVYAWTHAAWSPVAPDFSGALNEDLADELDVEASSVAVIGGRIVANCLVYRDETPPVVTAETAAADTPDGERLVEGCVRRSLDILAARGVTEAAFDGHVSDPHLLPVWTRLAPTGRWFHLVEVPATVAPASAG